MIRGFRSPLPGPRAGTPPAVPRLRCMLWVGAALALAGAAWAPPALAEEAPAAFAGSYRMEGWAGLEVDGIRHTFLLHADGHFELAAEWTGRERSRFTGTWSLGDGVIHLAGDGRVETNQGDWETLYRRSFRIGRTDEGAVRLTPVPEKNRYGLLGWPNAFIRHGPVPDDQGE